ncbi:nuclear envelope pore membrane protein [Aspergillus arachidicola]|uniref:Nuclear envelope pore membrane protein n=1 Tax=Aspergillus arachidicola TaxID=656916 RepID=A0A2G7FUC4_9EURO|nr:nuclear envelope pore membrane protein [Aspergillus arachidicola]
MNDTPRLRSAFPQTPQTSRKSRAFYTSPSRSKQRDAGLRQSPSKASPTAQDANLPLIPVELIDAPSQRLYIVAFYVALNAWRLYESWKASDDLDATWLFLKWACIDGVFLFGLQALRIPWLEWAFPTTLAIFLIHVVGNVFLMFRIPIPVGAWVSGIVKLAYDRELSISERSVKPGDIIHNASLILGKQIVHILPEGSAVLNPDQTPLCIDSEKATVNLPIRINQTDPILIELFRLDFTSGGNETITISSKQLKQMKRQAGKKHQGSGTDLHRDLLLPIRRPGIYRLQRVVDESNLDVREILEPSSCYLHNPPEPELAVRYEKIFDKCANNPVGLLVDLDFTGSPPFRLRYVVEHSKGIETKTQLVEGLRTQLDLTPSEAGLYRYRFLDIADTVYAPRPLKDKAPVLEQHVKPPASAHFLGSREVRKACFGEPVSVDVALLGEAPWTLQYELVHNGKKTKYVLETENEVSSIVTEKLVSGGEYSLVLTGVKDRSNCKRILKDSIQIDARPKPPHVSFGEIEKSREYSALQGSKVDIPLRLSGERPWTLKYKTSHDSLVVEKTLWQENSALTVGHEGRYELLGVTDASCPGSVDQAAKIFEVSWIPRPHITAVDGSPVRAGGHKEKRDVCQGENDNLELRLSGSPPYSIKYEQQRKTTRGSPSVRLQNLRTVLHVASMEMDTSEPGLYTYTFTEIGDNLYDHDPRSNPVVVTQKVNPLPSARFDAPGRIYGFCKEDVSGEELLPITLDGVPPFSLEISIKHHSKAKPELVSISNIASNRHMLPIPRRHLDLGQHVVSIHKVRDARGCQRATEYDASSVRVAVSDVPTVIPLESKADYCVGERLSFSLSGHAPFEVFYTFDGVARKATSRTTNFRRIAERPGVFTITAMPSVRISRGQTSIVDIHEGGEAELHFEFWGTPPFEFTYIRSSIARRGKRAEILDIKHDISYEHLKTIKTSDEGTYEVVAIKDKFCSVSSQTHLEKSEKPTRP